MGGATGPVWADPRGALGPGPLACIPAGGLNPPLTWGVLIGCHCPRVCLLGVLALIISWGALGLELAASVVSGSRDPSLLGRVMGEPHFSPLPLPWDMRARGAGPVLGTQQDKCPQGLEAGP